MNTASLFYDAASRFFHWAIFALLLIEFPIAWTMPDVHRDTLPNGLIAWHIFFGTLILAAMLLRVLWRLSGSMPFRVDAVSPALMLWPAGMAKPAGRVGP
ncbi:MAG: cytochrome b [Metallibacterium scheffleri]